jgi:uncharacterized membrane protein YdjX (TVP38/TMEM64 family)
MSESNSGTDPAVHPASVRLDRSGCGAAALPLPCPSVLAVPRGLTRLGRARRGRSFGADAGAAADRKSAWRNPWIVWAIRLFGVALLGLVGVGLWIAYDWHQEALWAWASDADPIPFFLLLTLLPAIGFPTSPFYLVAGAAFGTWTALVGSGVSMIAYLLISWWIAHTGLRPWIEARLARTPFRLPELQDPGQAVRFTLLVKVAPGVPATLKTYLLCLSGISFPVYFWVSFIVSMAYAAIFVLLGESVLEHDLGRLGWIVLALGLLGGLVWWLRRRWRSKPARTPTPTVGLSLPSADGRRSAP